MQKLKMIFSVCAIVFAFMGRTKIISYDISSPIMFVFLGLTLLVCAKECYDNGNKKYAVINLCVAIFVYVIIVYDIVSKMIAEHVKELGYLS